MSGDPVCINDFEKLAQECLPKKIWDYYFCGANAQQTFKDANHAFKRYRERNRVAGLFPDNSCCFCKS